MGNECTFPIILKHYLHSTLKPVNTCFITHHNFQINNFSACRPTWLHTCIV